MAPKRRAEGAGFVFLGKTRRGVEEMRGEEQMKRGKGMPAGIGAGGKEVRRKALGSLRLIFFQV